MAWTLLAAGLCFLIKDTNVKVPLVALFIYLFAMVYSVGEGPVVSMKLELVIKSQY